MSVRLALVVTACFALAACSGSEPEALDPPSSGSPTSVPTDSSPPVSSGDVCPDLLLVEDVQRFVQEGTAPYRQAAAAVASAGKVIRSGVDTVPAGPAAKKMRQLVLYMNTLRLAILGAVENYPEDYAVRQFNRGLPRRVQDISEQLDCPA